MVLFRDPDVAATESENRSCPSYRVAHDSFV